MNQKLFPLVAFALTGLAVGAVQAVPVFPEQDQVCVFNSTREAQRTASAANFPQPVVTQLFVNGVLKWSTASTASPAIAPGDTIKLVGTGLGNGPDIDFTKIMFGDTRVLETDLSMFEAKLDILSTANFEENTLRSSWPKDIVSWTPTQVEFKVPLHVSKGPLKLQIQKRDGYLPSLTRPGQPHNVIDTQLERLEVSARTNWNCDVISKLSAESKAITPINVTVNNPNISSLVTLGRKIFWSYDYGLGVAQSFKGLKWDKIFAGQTTDPYTRAVANPATSFNAYKTVAGEVPAEAINEVFLDPYPQKSPIPGFLLVSSQKFSGNTKNSGWVGYRSAESSHPLQGNGSWIGFNCAACHGYRISFKKGSNTVTKVFPGLPNPGWTTRWTTLGDKSGDTTANFSYINGDEPGPAWAPGTAKVDKTPLLYHMPPGTAEAAMTRTAGVGTIYDNDYVFSPTAIPNVTNYLAIRRSLSHTESYVGFEGSYIHAQEPEGAFGSMDANSLRALTAYMATLNQDDNDLINAGVYRWLKGNGKLNQTGSTSTTEGSFVQSGWHAYPGVASAVNAGKATFDAQCASCHADKLGTNTTEKMIPLTEVGRFFAPTDFQYRVQAIRATFLRNLYWVSSRGFLSDAHVRNLEDLVHPDRCTTGSALYNQYYTLHAPARPSAGTPDTQFFAPDLNRKGDVYRIPKATKKNIFDTTSEARNLFVERHKYFSTRPGDSSYYYWDFQKMRTQFGPEMGAPGPIGMPATPHPWCASSASEVSNLVQYLLTL